MTTLSADFLAAIVTMTAFKPRPMLNAEAALLYLGLRGGDFTACELPGEVTGGSKHLPGAATGALIAQGLIEVVGRIKSPKENAKGRKLDLLRIPAEKRQMALLWLRRNGYPAEERQAEFAMEGTA
jgi:hypothetical protein